MKSETADAAAATVAEDTGSLGFEGLSGELMDSATAEGEQEQGEEQQEQEIVEGSEEEAASILERYGLQDAPEDDLRELNRELGGRVAERFGDLTARAQNAERESQRLRSELEKREPFEKQGPNPYSGESELSKLEDIHAAALETIRNGEDALDDNSSLGADDEIEVFGGTYTKSQIRAAVRKAKEARDVHLPARARELQAVSGYEQQREANLAAVKADHPWMSEEGNELRAKYEAEAPQIIAAVREKMPEMLPMIDRILAGYAAFSAGPAKPAARNPSPQTRKTPPGAPGGAGGASSRPASASKRRQAASQQFMESDGSLNDLTKFFMAT